MGCGCDTRKEIMFQHGKPGRTELAIIALAIIIPLLAWRLTQ